MDIFDAGPTVEANLKHIRSAQTSIKMQIKVTFEIDNSQPTFFVINTKVQDFRGVCTTLVIDTEHATIGQQAADALGVSDGDNIRFAPTHFRT